MIAAGLGLAAALSVGVHKISYLSPNNMYDSIQLAISKALLLGVIAYMLVLYSRNFMAHKHNAVINRHRQNALRTFNALAEASKSDDRRDIILSHAAACIFSPQDTGYTKSHQATDTPVTKLIEILPKSGAASS